MRPPCPAALLRRVQARQTMAPCRPPSRAHHDSSTRNTRARDTTARCRRHDAVPARRCAAHRRVPTSRTPLQPSSPALSPRSSRFQHCRRRDDRSGRTTTAPPLKVSSGALAQRQPLLPIKATRAALHRHAELAEPLALSPFFLLASTSTFFVLRQEQNTHQSPLSSHPGQIPFAVSTSTPSSTCPIPRPSLSLPEQSSPRAPTAATMAVRGGPSSTPFPMPGVAEMKPRHPPLSPNAPGFGNGGRERRSGGA
ncbi:hypothetical protein C2845_PM15G16740 [Panicum miliaceum]|uniref:Uncharacterized protein n=1 Tax=Panicum miliaceum TaxID=4540 RepID=A0A3L6Q821_PANMI|nr:hypothetical protein C2845_PM15G16740 [Panicum miliaceum]